MTEPTALIDLHAVSLSIDKKTILQKINLRIKEKEIVTLVGPNGAGKSTLLKIALGLTKPSSGSVYRRPALSIGYVPQSVNKDYTMPVSVTDFIRLAKTKHSYQNYQQIMQELSLQSLEQKLISELSGGELRRVLFARALLNKPELLVLDEPTAGVDVNGQEAFYQQLKSLREQYGFAILMVSHDLHLVMSATDRVICLNQHICCQGHPVHVLEDPHYQALFSDKPATSDMAIAFYEHHHDHVHE